MSRPVLTIAAQWQEVSGMIENLDEVDRGAVNEWRRLFYGGAKAMLSLLQQGADPDALEEECKRFAQALLDGKA
jgi:hypothetical protein